MAWLRELTFDWFLCSFDKYFGFLWKDQGPVLGKDPRERMKQKQILSS